MHALRGIQRPTWNVSNQPKNGFDRCVIIYTSSASARGICVKTYSYAYTLCVGSLILTAGYVHLKQFEEHLKTIWCVIAAIADMVSVEMMTNQSLLK